MKYLKIAVLVMELLCLAGAAACTGYDVNQRFGKKKSDVVDAEFREVV